MTRCRAEIRTYHLPNNERMRYVLCNSHEYEKCAHLTSQRSAQMNNFLIIIILENKE